MNQPPSRLCPRCETPTTADQRFCPNCGAVIDRNEANPTALANEQDFSQYPSISIPPPPPNVDSYSTLRQQSNYTQYSGSIPPYQQQPAEGSYVPSYTDPSSGQVPPSQNYAPPAFVRPTKDPSKSRRGKMGCRVGLGILLLLVIFSALAYGLYAFVNHSASPVSHSDSSGSTTSNSDVTPPSVPAKTIPLNLTVKYATITFTIIDMKQATSFNDDTSSGAPGTVRIDLKEVNSTSQGVNVAYPDVARLILPDQSSIPPENYKHLQPPANGATQDNWLDFPVPTSVSVDKLMLQLGTAQEAQMTIPLTPSADLIKYQDVTVKPNARTTYTGLKWMLTSATLSWSADSKQADSGKRFVTVNVSVDNPTSTAQRGYWGDYIRLKSGSLTSSPEIDTTIPLEFNAGSTGITGSASFAVLQDISSFTLILLADKVATGSPQATIDFHIP